MILALLESAQNRRFLDKMDMSNYRRLVGLIGFGKRLPSAIYILRQPSGRLPAETEALVAHAETAAQPSNNWNLLKLHLDEVAFTFLSYPEFDVDPHPALAEATKINLNTALITRVLITAAAQILQFCTVRKRFSDPMIRALRSFLP